MVWTAPRIVSAPYRAQPGGRAGDYRLAAQRLAGVGCDDERRGEAEVAHTFLGPRASSPALDARGIGIMSPSSSL